MTESQPIPSWVRAIGWLLIVSMLPLVALGGQTTTRVAGMADPVWPTEPLYLAFHSHVFYEEPQPGFLLEHTHRLAGWIAGGLASLFAIGVWLSDRGPHRLAGLGFTVLLLITYGAFHGAMMKIKNDPQSFGLPQSVPGLISIGFAIGLITVGVYGLVEKHPGGFARLFASLGLVGVMIQGLLGGFRVLLNLWFGPELAIVHGCFAHVVFCTLLAAVIFCRQPTLDFSTRERLLFGRGFALAAFLVLTQLIWGALTRHGGSALAQRLHLITAFLATAAIIAAVGAIRNSPRKILTWHALALIVIVFAQVSLGIEAYLGKFVSTGSYAHLPPSQRPISNLQALTRTSHVLVGLALLSTLVSGLVRIKSREDTIPLETHGGV
jgi:heme a synthase